MICFPNAKINLGLSVVAKRADGYHELETIFYPIDWCDSLEMIENKENVCRFHPSGIIVDGDMESNLVIKAYRKLQEHYDLPGTDIYLYKAIPFGAGLGGGSSDASFALKLLGEIYNLNISDDELIETASKLGADCAFFIKNKPVYATGIGDKFSDIDLSLKGYHMVVVKPGFGVSTKEAFSNIKPAKPENSVYDIIKLPVEKWKELLKNDFETTVFKLYPSLEVIKQTLYDNGAVYSSMSGSGSAIFGLFREKPDLAGQFKDCILWQGECLI